MITELISFAVVGLILVALGLLTWKKQTPSFLHSYHYKNVKEEDIPAYTKQMGIGQIVIGIGLCLVAGLRLITKSKVSWLGLVAGLIGLVIFHDAQKKYNGSWFS